MEVDLEIEAYQSLIFVFSKEMDAPTVEAVKAQKPEILDISHGWTLQVEQAGFEKTYERLVSWEQEQELKF